MVNTQSARDPVLRTIETPVCMISLLENGIIRTSYKSDVVVTLEEIKIIELALFEMSNNKTFKNLLDSRGGYTTFEADARQYAANSPITKSITVAAFVVNTLPLKLLVNFYIQFNKPAYKIKVFSDYELARWWLINYSA
jgi:hypothetical protein